MNYYHLIATQGIGDTYNTASLCQAFKNKYCQNSEKLTLTVKHPHQYLAELFPGIDEVNVVTNDITNPNATQFPTINTSFSVHPSVCLVRPDHCIAIESLNDLSMYMLILGLDPRETIPTLPTIPDRAKIEALRIASQANINIGHTAVIVPTSNSWPNIPSQFWDLLKQKLTEIGWDIIDNDTSISLDVMLPFSELAGWVIGTNCGLMQTIVQSQTKCRKTILTQAVWPDLPNGPRHPHPISSTMQYRNFRKIDGNKYDIEEFRVDSGGDSPSYDHVTNLVAYGRNSRGEFPVSEPLSIIDMEVSPGEFLDKLTILLTKISNLPNKGHLLGKEVEALSDIRNKLVNQYPQLFGLEVQLLDLNEIAWENNEILIQEYSDVNFGSDDWIGLQDKLDTTWEDKSKSEKCIRAFGKAHRANQQRVRIKNEINRICGAAMREEKSYD